MLTVEIINDGTGTNARGNYTYRVLVNGRVVDEGRVEGHWRAERWPTLLLAVSKDAEQRASVRMYADLVRLAEEADAARTLQGMEDK